MYVLASSARREVTETPLIRAELNPVRPMINTDQRNPSINDLSPEFVVSHFLNFGNILRHPLKSSDTALAASV